ncbi:hypothetical protein FUA23_17665 [Neolewinella aurantiaca]|uniref:Uncharacterized protein n=1 Tax=Neolewinella aurantiaca TaxID=2602767 RepID=A0A5C7FAV1_9BACT|nr:hypothetical protein [Neolewinella aurantiaca]TXF87758.1 hypothetical protein FUA23_17665 [Neolewinella aurantiaca]
MNATNHYLLTQQLHEAAVSNLQQGLESSQQFHEQVLGTNAPNALLDSAATGEQISASVHWWGVDIVMNEKLTDDIINGITGGGAVGSAIAAAFGAAGVVTGGVATAIGAAIGAIVALKIAEIKIVNNGSGVHWPITWPQWALLLAALPAGPAGIITAGMAFIHPLRN